MIIKCDESITNLVKRIIERETVNTDFYFVNEVNNLANKIKEVIKIKL